MVYDELKDTIVLDIETATYKPDSVDVERDNLKYIGIRLPNGNKLVYTENQLDAVQRTVNRYKYVVGHNIKEYDRPILERYGIRFFKNTIIDTMLIAMKRFKTMLYIDMYSFSLKNIAKELHLPVQKGEFDYEKLRNGPLSSEDYKELVEYLHGDLDTTYELFLWCYKLFYGIREFFSKEDIAQMKWLTSSSGMTAGKAICNQVNIPFDIDNKAKHIGYDGAYIWVKDIDAVHGLIYSNDWNSLYPHMMMGMNSFCRNKSVSKEVFADERSIRDRQNEIAIEINRIKKKIDLNIYKDYEDITKEEKKNIDLFRVEVLLQEMNDLDNRLNNIDYTIDNPDEYWHGSGIYKSVEEDSEDGIRGYYSKTMGKVEQFLRSLYHERVDIKKEIKVIKKEWKGKEMPIDVVEKLEILESQQLSRKILLNTAYGVLGNQLFKRLYDPIAASDVTAMARASNKYAATRLSEIGCDLIYLHTDSVYYNATGVDNKLLEDTINDVVKIQKESFNINIDTHNFARESEIKHMYLFRDSKGNIVKARNLYITTDDKLHYTGIKLAKASTSDLAKLVFNKYMFPLLNQNKPNPYFSINNIYSWLEKEAKENPELVSKRYRVKPVDEYKTISSIQSKISELYGSGEHYLVANTSGLGIDGTTRWCLLSELQDIYGDHWCDFLNLNKYVEDLNEFILPAHRSVISKIQKDSNGLYYNYRKQRVDIDY